MFRTSYKTCGVGLLNTTFDDQETDLLTQDREVLTLLQEVLHLAEDAKQSTAMCPPRKPFLLHRTTHRTDLLKCRRRRDLHEDWYTAKNPSQEVLLYRERNSGPEMHRLGEAQGSEKLGYDNDIEQTVNVVVNLRDLTFCLFINQN